MSILRTRMSRREFRRRALWQRMHMTSVERQCETVMCRCFWSPLRTYVPPLPEEEHSHRLLTCLPCKPVIILYM